MPLLRPGNIDFEHDRRVTGHFGLAGNNFF